MKGSIRSTAVPTSLAAPGRRRHGNCSLCCDRCGGYRRNPTFSGRQREQRKARRKARAVRTAESAHMQASERKVSFRNAKSNRIVGILTEAASPDVVVLCHGLSSHKNGFHLPALARALELRGIGSLRLDLSGNGESEGDFRYANQAEEAGDIDAAVKFLSGLGKTASGLLGHSKSGSSVLLYASKYGQIPRVVCVSGRYDHKRGIEARFGDDVFERVERDGGIQLSWQIFSGRKDWVFDKQDLQERMTIDMAAICAAIPDNTRVLTIHGSQDATIPVEDSKNFANRLPGSRLLVIEGADHNYTRQSHSDQMISAAVEFLVTGEVS